MTTPDECPESLAALRREMGLDRPLAVHGGDQETGRRREAMHAVYVTDERGVLHGVMSLHLAILLVGLAWHVVARRASSRRN